MLRTLFPAATKSEQAGRQAGRRSPCSQAHSPTHTHPRRLGRKSRPVSAAVRAPPRQRWGWCRQRPPSCSRKEGGAGREELAQHFRLRSFEATGRRRAHPTSTVDCLPSPRVSLPMRPPNHEPPEAEGHAMHSNDAAAAAKGQHLQGVHSQKSNAKHTQRRSSSAGGRIGDEPATVLTLPAARQPSPAGQPPRRTRLEDGHRQGHPQPHRHLGHRDAAVVWGALGSPVTNEAAQLHNIGMHEVECNP
jgi:hypothetical protein